VLRTYLLLTPRNVVRPSDVARWVRANRVGVLNVAGNRERVSKWRGATVLDPAGKAGSEDVGLCGILIKRSGGPMRWWAFVAVVIAGYGGNRPFEPGGRASLVNPGNNKVLVVNTTGGPQAIQTVAAGTRVAIVNDPGPPGVAGQMIRVELLDPPFQGLQGDVPRNRLRPG
jgi:hypothetical protein